MNVSITVSYDRVEVEGVEIRRPSRVSPIQWLDFWECEKEASLVEDLAFSEEECKKLQKLLEEKNEEIMRLLSSDA